jgi:lipopolysaccharide/colanic/teichoic acid biosynthesis glycosyltransferase
MTRPVLFQLDVHMPELDLFLAFCLISSLISTIAIIALAWANPWRLARPALLIALLLAIFFQWPTTLLADPIQESLPNRWFYAVAVNVIPLSLAGWAWLTRFADLPASSQSHPRFTLWQISLPLALSLLLGAIFLAQVPIDCTAAYALLFDPKMTLVAREFAGKLAAARFSSYSFGALVNTTAPVAVAIAGALMVASLRIRNVAHLMLWIAILVSMVGLVMLSGTKGLLVPSFLLIVVSAAIWNSTPVAKGIAIFVTVGLLAMSVVGFEVAKERRAMTGEGYDLASCSVRAGVCAQSKELIASLLKREASLGLSRNEVKRLQDELKEECDDEDILVQSGKDGLTTGPNQSSLPEAGAITRMDWIGRGLIYAKAIAYRAFVIPTQVATWHFLYAAESGHPGFAAMPMARYLSPTMINMPEVVYQRYGAVYSGGDRTSTSTSPTSFALAYPAYLGWPGILVAILAMVALDVVWSALLRRLDGPLLALSAGLLTIVGMNLILSDFVTVMTSHGGAAAIVLLTVYAATKNYRLLKRFVDFAVSLLLIVILAVPLGVLAVIVRTKLGSPILFVQERPGLKGRPFKLYKFRTMTDARDVNGDLLPDEQRLTPFGRFLRSTSLDELPELWNVLKGDMSLVGPRPLLMEYLPLYSFEQARRHEVRPGITGWAQINGRNALGWEARFEHDVWYVDNQSLWLDIRILAATLGKIIRREGISSPHSATMEKFQG